MNKIDTTCEHSKIRLIAAAIGMQQCTKTAGTEVKIPGTDKRILIGNDAYLAKVAAPAAPASPEQVQAIPAGYALVPLVCTPEMRAAWDRTPQSEDDDVEFHGAYRAMIDAAPKAVQVQAERAQFQAHFMAEGWSERSFERYNIYDPKDERSYKSRHVADMWDGWSARASLAAPSAAAPAAPSELLSERHPLVDLLKRALGGLALHDEAEARAIGIEARKLVSDKFDAAQEESVAAEQVAIPEGYVLMPKRLTAENGAKGALSGGFKECITVTCHECDGSGEDDEYDSACVECKGAGTLEQGVPVTWDTIKDIYAAVVELLAAAPAAPIAAAQVQPNSNSPEFDGIKTAAQVQFDAVLRKLCDQLDAMKRTMFLRPGTGQHYSYLVHEDVQAYVEQARKALAATGAAQVQEEVRNAKDAERYRFLRHADLDELARTFWPDADVPEGDELDKAIDAAMKTAASTEGEARDA